ncbi:hypothetical protein RND81_07G176300 [Saponaria officinalis]|uniref:SBP-type domain-containing protein n=1 Tax=Saponaria officinalis TaxID=3572 RepID=A0AAW1JUZ1_SAPOF
MDSWKCISEERGIYLPEEIDFEYDNHGYNKNKLIGCESKPLLNVESQGFERFDLMNMGFCDDIISSDPSEELFSDEIGTDYSMQSNGKLSSIVDLKLGGLGDGGIGTDCESGLSRSFVGSCLQIKRSRSTSSLLQSPRCQVLGCNKDLGSYKGYYRRHKVCEEHTRTARVNVNGMEQRFCQQCSRFHQLAEFDDHKRSCRKRLAVHNKRRRKPRFSSEHESLPTDTTCLSKLEEWKWAEQVKIEDSIGNSDMFFPIISRVAENTKDIPADVKDKVISTPTCTILDSSIIRHPSRALSLLSAQSRDTDSNSEHPHNTVQGIFKETIQIRDSRRYLMEADNVDHIMTAHSECATDNPHLPGDGFLRESEIRSSSLGHGIILDLLQLSSRLQSIEHQKSLTESEAG